MEVFYDLGHRGSHRSMVEVGELRLMTDGWHATSTDYQ